MERLLPCSGCQHGNQLSARFCVNCGMPLPARRTCEACSATFPRESLFCPECGVPAVSTSTGANETLEQAPWGVRDSDDTWVVERSNPPAPRMREPYRRLDEDDVHRTRQMDEDYARELDAGRDPKMQVAGRDQDMQMEALMRQMMQMTQDARHDQATQMDAQMMKQMMQMMLDASRDQATQMDAQMRQMKDKVDGEN